MYNRYEGNTGRYRRMEEPAPPVRSPMTVQRRSPINTPAPTQAAGAAKRPQQAANPLANIMRLLTGDGRGEGQRINALTMPGGAALETEDLILLLILYLMYRESGDKELLIALGAMLLL